MEKHKLINKECLKYMDVKWIKYGVRKHGYATH